MRVMLIEGDTKGAGVIEQSLTGLPGSAALDRQPVLDAALDRLEQEHFDIAILDLDSPGDDMDSLLHLRSRAPLLPIVSLAGNASEAQALRAIQMGAQDYFEKSQISSINLGLRLQLAIERKQIANIRQATLQDLEGRQKDMESFVYSVCHDLKEPLRTIEAFSSFVLADYKSVLDNKGQDYLSRLTTASQRMKGMIEELLLLTQLGRKPHELQRINMRQALDELILASQVSIDERDAQVRIADDLPDVLGDRPRIAQIFGNLINNGLKFNRSQQPTVEISCCDSTAAWATYCVKDNGIGIDPQYHERIFGVFQRLHTVDEFSGSGAGLTISKSAAEALGGTIWLESTPGAGTTFFVRLPLWEDKSKVSRKADKNGAAV